MNYVSSFSDLKFLIKYLNYPFVPKIPPLGGPISAPKSNFSSVSFHLSSEKGEPVGRQSIQIVGIFHEYPIGVFNPAFTGMYLWELLSSHELNDYQIC